MRNLLGACALLLVIAGALATATPAQAVGPISCSDLEIRDLTGDTRLDLMTLRCDLEGNGSHNDIITMFDRQGRLQPNQSWGAEEGFTNNIWIFDVGGDGNAEFIIDFQLIGKALVADLYDRQSAETLAYRLDSTGFSWTVSPRPTVRMTAPDGWWTRDELINYNLDIDVDGLVDAVFEVPVKRDLLADFLLNDGFIDMSIRIRDRNGNGRPEFDWRTISFKNPSRKVLALVPRSYLMVNERDDEPPIVPVFPWPHIGGPTYGYLTSAPRPQSQPPIQLDWTTGTISAVGEYVRSRGNDGQWFVYSFAPIKPNQRTTTNFESPFGWYDLAEDRDRNAELAVRFGYYSKNDLSFLGAEFSRPIANVRYSWDQNNDGFWDYKLGLLGNHEVVDTVTFPEFELTLLPYANMPRWLMEKIWGPTFFVAAEHQVLGEGIYEWDPPAWLTEGYFAGRATNASPPEGVPGFETIGKGFRGEYSLNLAERVVLYLSPVDRLLHLRGAHEGVWNIDDYKRVRYTDTDGDGYIDLWLATALSSTEEADVDESIIESLAVADDYVFFSSRSTVQVRAFSLTPSLFEVAPPSDHAEWVALQEQLSRFRAGVATDDLRSLFASLDGSQFTINGASFSEFRRAEDGKFRFLLRLEPGFRVEGQDVLGVRNLEPGAYSVSFEQTFNIQAAGAPNVILVVEPYSADASTAPEVLSLRIDLTNGGARDLSALTLSSSATDAFGEVAWQAAYPATLLAGSQEQLLLSMPSLPVGIYELSLELHDSESVVLARVSQMVEVPAVHRPASSVSIVDNQMGIVYAGIILFLIGALAGIVTRNAFREETRHKLEK